jgi:predicted PurR-regulated permease PerM
MIPNVSLHSSTRLGLNIFLLLAGVVALRLAESVIIPLLIALLLASVLGPAAAWLHNVLKIRWSIACLVVIFGLLLFNGLLTLVFVLMASRLAQQFPSPHDDEQIIKLYKNVRDRVEAISPVPLDEELFPPNPQRATDVRVLQYLAEAAPGMTREVVRYLSSWLWQWILIIFILLFLLLEGRMLARRVVAIFGPSAEVQARAGEVLRAMAEQVRRYVIVRTIINFGLALIMGVIYQLLGLSQGWTWAFALAILNYIPYLGPLIAGAPPFMDAFLSPTAGPVSAIIVTIFYTIMIVVEGYLIVPLLMGRSMDLNATTVMLACLFWELVWGLTGLFLAMPIMAALKAILQQIPEGQPWADLMSTSDEIPKPVVIPPDLGNGASGNGLADAPAAGAYRTPGAP